MSNINWKYFVAAAEELNFTRAAEKLFISQQSLSSYIVKLEASIGMELFNRGKTLTLTAAGESLYNNAKKILSMEELAEKELQDIRDYKTSSLRIGISRSRGAKILPQVLYQFKSMYPDLKVELVEKRLKEIKKDLLDGSIDLILGYVEEVNPELVYEVYHQEKMIVVISESVWNSYIPKEKQETILQMEKVPLEEFRECPFILLKDGSWQNGKIRAYCSKKNFTLKEELQSVNMETIVNLAAVGYGATICPSIYAQDKFIKGISSEKVYRFVLDDPLFSPDGAIIYMKKRYLPKVARDFIEICKKMPM